MTRVDVIGIKEDANANLVLLKLFRSSASKKLSSLSPAQLVLWRSDQSDEIRFFYVVISITSV